jgi:hypothetical protein
VGDEADELAKAARHVNRGVVLGRRLRNLMIFGRGAKSTLIGDLLFQLGTTGRMAGCPTH